MPVSKPTRDQWSMERTREDARGVLHLKPYGALKYYLVTLNGATIYDGDNRQEAEAAFGETFEQL